MGCHSDVMINGLDLRYPGSMSGSMYAYSPHSSLIFYDSYFEVRCNLNNTENGFSVEMKWTTGEHDSSMRIYFLCSAVQKLLRPSGLYQIATL
jgi:hypothetical protein